MGSRNSIAYLASPAIVAYSAINGYISSPFSLVNKKPVGTIMESPSFFIFYY